MSDAAAFFANKKKKKKAFKFNANLVDVSSVTATVHVDAPALSTEQDPAAVGTSSAGESNNHEGTLDKGGPEWDDEALAAATPVRSTAASESSGAIRDMKTHTGTGTGTDNIAEKLRVEETKAQLAAARQGMEREAMKLKEEREKEEQKKEEASKSRFGAAAAAGAGSTGKWVSSRARTAQAAGGGMLPKLRMGGGKLDVQDQELFPDLAAADKILEKKEKDSQPVFKPPKKTPVGGGASWASKMTPKKTPAAVVPKPKPKEADPAPVEAAPEAPKPTATVTPAPAPAPAARPVKKTTKKKKKDISTFIPGS